MKGNRQGSLSRSISAFFKLLTSLKNGLSLSKRLFRQAEAGPFGPGPKAPLGFLTKGWQSTARMFCAPTAHKTRPCSLRGISCQTHVAAGNNESLLRAWGANSARLFRQAESGSKEPGLFLSIHNWQQKISYRALGQIPVLTRFCRTYLLVNPWQERASCRD